MLWIEHIFKDFMNRAGVRYYTPLNVLETCFYLLFKAYENDDTKSDGINFILNLTGKKSVDRIKNIQNYMDREKGNMILPF